MQPNPCQLSERILPDNALRVIVTQLGARHHYAVPRMLFEQGVLSRFYTDFCLKGRVAQIASASAPLLGRRVTSLVRRRTIAGVPGSIVYSAPLVNLQSALSLPGHHGDRFRRENEDFSRQMIEWGTGDANVLYGIAGSGQHFWRAAKAAGLKIAVDVIISPMYGKIVERERAAFPEWEGASDREDPERAQNEAFFTELINIADLLVCPAPAVVDGLHEFANPRDDMKVPLPPTVVVPYGASTLTFRRGTPERGRVLFVGTAELRKGIHYLADAAAMLAECCGETHVRIAGVASERVRARPETRALTFLGHLANDQLVDELMHADVFVLPSLAEGSSGAIYEALAAGLPVITTRSAGSVITDGREGLIVPERDSAALASAIERVVRDRELRGAMSNAAIETARLHDEGQWGGRLMEALRPLAQCYTPPIPLRGENTASGGAALPKV